MDFNIASALKYSAEGNGFRLDPGFMEEPEFQQLLITLDSLVEDKKTSENQTTSFDEGMITK